MRFCLASVEQVFKCGFLTKLPLLSVPFVSAKCSAGSPVKILKIVF